MTQTDRVLRALRNGPLVSTDFMAPTVRDGGKPIMRVAARIKQLRDQGVPIATTRRPNGVAVYTLAQASVAQDGRTTEGKSAAAASPTGPAVVPGATDARPGDDLTASTVAASPSSSPLPPAAGASLFDADAYRAASHHYPPGGRRMTLLGSTQTLDGLDAAQHVRIGRQKRGVCFCGQTITNHGVGMCGTHAEIAIGEYYDATRESDEL